MIFIYLFFVCNVLFMCLSVFNVVKVFQVVCMFLCAGVFKGLLTVFRSFLLCLQSASACGKEVGGLGRMRCTSQRAHISERARARMRTTPELIYIYIYI